MTYVRVQLVEISSEVSDGTVRELVWMLEVAIVELCWRLGHDVLVVGRAVVRLSIVIGTETE